MNKLTQLYSEFKALVSTSAIETGNVSAIEFKKAAANDDLLSLINFEDAQTVKYTKPVLKTYVSVEQGTENTAPALSLDPVFVSQKPVFDKLETQLGITNEIIQDSGINIMSSVMEQIGIQQSVKMQFEALNHDVFGIGNGLIDRSNSFVESLKPDADRADNIYSVTKSGIAGEFGTDLQTATDYVLGLIGQVPSRYHTDLKIFMSRSNWFDNLLPLLSVDAAATTQPLMFKGYEIVILDNMPVDTVFVGSLMNAYQGVPLANSEMVESDMFTVKGTEILYHYLRYSFIPLDNTAIRVGILAV